MRGDTMAKVNNNVSEQNSPQNSKQNENLHINKHVCLCCKHFSRFYTRNFKNFEKQDYGICYFHLGIKKINESCFSYVEKERRTYMQDPVCEIVERLNKDICMLKSMIRFDMFEDYKELIKE